MSEKQRATFAQLAEYADTRTLECEIPEGVVELVFNVPIGSLGVELHNALEGLKDEEDVVSLIAPFVGKLVDDAADLNPEQLQRVVRTVGVNNVLDTLMDCAGLKVNPDDLSPDRSGGRPAS